MAIISRQSALQMAAERVIDSISQTCPHCGAKDVRLHGCEHGGRFRGCIACVTVHDEGVARIMRIQEAEKTV